MTPATEAYTMFDVSNRKPAVFIRPDPYSSLSRSPCPSSPPPPPHPLPPPPPPSPRILQIRVLIVASVRSLGDPIRHMESRFLSVVYRPGHLAKGRMENCERFPLRLLSFLVYELNEFFAEALVSTRNLEDLGIAFFGQSFFCKRPLHL